MQQAKGVGVHNPQLDGCGLVKPPSIAALCGICALGFRCGTLSGLNQVVEGLSNVPPPMFLHLVPLFFDTFQGLQRRFGAVQLS